MEPLFPGDCDDEARTQEISLRDIVETLACEEGVDFETERKAMHMAHSRNDRIEDEVRVAVRVMIILDEIGEISDLFRLDEMIDTLGGVSPLGSTGGAYAGMEFLKIRKDLPGVDCLRKAVATKLLQLTDSLPPNAELPSNFDRVWSRVATGFDRVPCERPNSRDLETIREAGGLLGFMRSCLRKYISE